jgi:hypothetical protein
MHGKRIDAGRASTVRIRLALEMYFDNSAVDPLASAVRLLQEQWTENNAS